MARPDWMLDRKIVDADEPFSINIRQRDIDLAVGGDGAACVAARCILRSQDALAVYVYRSKTYVVWDDDSPILRYQNSARLVRDVIRILDDPRKSNRKIKPGVYWLNAISPAQALGRDRTAKGKKRGPHPSHSKHRVMARFYAAAG